MGGLSMTREEQIIEAGIEYTMQNNPVCISGDNFHEMSKMLNRNKSFEEGAKWADKNPNLDSLWHTPDEPPEPKKRLIVHCDEEKEWDPIDQLVYYEGPEYSWDKTVKIYSILHWAYAKDLVPNFNEKL